MRTLLKPLRALFLRALQISKEQFKLNYHVATVRFANKPYLFFNDINTNSKLRININEITLSHFIHPKDEAEAASSVSPTTITPFI